MSEKAVWDAINAHFDGQLDLATRRTVAGGDINDSYTLSARDGTPYFVKLNAEPGLLLTEQLNLQKLADTALKTPEPLYFTVEGGTAGLVLEYLDLQSSGDEYELGRQLARMHAQTAESFGLDYDNYIGATAQANSAADDWVTFWVERRLIPQLDWALAAGHSLAVDKNEAIDGTRRQLAGHEPDASLLHGDLWAGNKGFLSDGTPVVFDPATYYGDRETDLAFTRVFGGYGADFYQGYESVWPLPEGWQAREDVYNLYHLLNHLNLFGGGYLGSVNRLLRTVVGD